MLICFYPKSTHHHSMPTPSVPPHMAHLFSAPSTVAHPFSAPLPMMLPSSAALLLAPQSSVYTLYAPPIAAPPFPAPAPPTRPIKVCSADQTSGHAHSHNSGVIGKRNACPPPVGPSGDPEDHLDKKKFDKEIDNSLKEKFLIDSEVLKSANGRSCRNMKCEVEQFKLNTDLFIKNLINQMETYFTIGQVFPKRLSASCW